MKKLFLLLLSTVLLTLTVRAQVENRALTFQKNGRVSMGTLSDLDNATAWTVQWWMNPTHWTNGATILQRGSNFAIQMGSTGTLTVTVGNETASFADTGLATGVWNHVSLIADSTSLKLYVNNGGEQTKTLTANALPEGTDPILLGGGFTGRLDEVRIWTCALPSDYNRFWNNTIDSRNPSWAHLVGYWKFDQNRLASHVYDYSEKGHNGTFSAAGVTRNAVTDNAKFKYRRNLAYSDPSRYFDRGIRQGQYLGSNVISMIGATAQADGSVRLKQPDDQGTITGGTYLANYEGRGGVLKLNGTGAQMNVGPNVLLSRTDQINNATTAAYTFMTWVYLNQWTPGAYLLQKESAADNGISLRLGDTEGTLILRCNGTEFTYTDALQQGAWHHVGFSTASATLGSEFVMVVDGSTKAPTYTHQTAITPTLSELHSTDCLIGVNLDGYLDETIAWSQAFGASNIQSQGTTPLMPGIGKTISGGYGKTMDGRWAYDVESDLGRDSYSTIEFFRQIRATFDGYEGYYLTISIDKYDAEFFTKVNNNTEGYQEKLATAIAALGMNPVLDGVDYDFEWNNNWTGIGNVCEKVYAKMNMATSGKIQAVSPHELYYNFPTGKMQYVTYFNFQNYGPGSKNIFNYTNYQNFLTTARNYGYPADKILLSYATTTSGALTSSGSRVPNTSSHFYPTGWRSLGCVNDGTVQYGTNSYDVSDGTYYFTGMEQTWQRSALMNNQDCCGIFYWDMGNDYPDPTSPLSLARYASYGVNANVQKVIESVDGPEAPAEFTETLGGFYRIQNVQTPSKWLAVGTGGLVAEAQNTTSVNQIFKLEKTGTNQWFIGTSSGQKVAKQMSGNTQVQVTDSGDPYYWILSGDVSYFDGNSATGGGFPDAAGASRALMYNNGNINVWGTWNANTKWTVYEISDMDIYTILVAADQTVTYAGQTISDGGFIAVPAGTPAQTIKAGLSSEKSGYQAYFKVNTADMTISVAYIQPEGYYRIKGAKTGHDTHYIYQNGDQVYAGAKAAEAKSIIKLEKVDDESTVTYYLKGNDGRYIQDRTGMANTNAIYTFNTTPISYNIVSYGTEAGDVYLQQTNIVSCGITNDVHRCLKCNGTDAGVTTWGPWTDASHWMLEPVTDMDIYTLTLSDINTVTYTAEGYTGTQTLYNGSFIALPTGTEPSASHFTGSVSHGYKLATTIDTEAKTITIQVALLIPESGHFYRFKSATGNGKYLSSTLSGTVMTPTTNADATTIFYYNGNKLMAYESGQYVTLNGLAYDDGSPITFPAAQNGNTGINIESSTGRFLFGGYGAATITTGSSTQAKESGVMGYNWTVEEVTTLPLHLSDAGYATFSAPVDLTLPEGLEAYYAAEHKSSYVTMTQISDIPAQTGVILKGGEGDYHLPIGTATSAVTTNLLKPAVSATAITPEAEHTAYIFSHATQGAGFYKMSTATDANRISGHKCWLELPTQTSVAQFLAFSFDNEATAISELEAEHRTQSLGQPGNQNGKYIENGHLVIVKHGQKYNAKGQPLSK